MRNALFGGLLAAASLAGAARADDIKLGYIAGLSGGGASYGAGMLQGVEMAVKEINDAGGIGGRKIVLDIADDDSDPSQSVLAMQRLIGDRVAAVLGGWGSSMVLASMEPAERAGMPFVVFGASNPRITTSRNKWTFRLLTNDGDQARQLADLVVKQLHLQRIAVLSDSNDYGVGCRDAFLAELKALGVTPVRVESYGFNDRDFTAQLTHIVGENPDGLATFGTLPAIPAIMNQARDLGIEARFFGTAGLGTEALIGLAPESSQHAIATMYFHPDIDPEAKAWAARYTAAYAHATPPARPSQAAWGYRAVKLVMAPCLAQAGADKDKLRDCLAHWHGPVFGLPPVDAHFSAVNQLVAPVVFVQIAGKQFDLLPGAN